MKAPLRFKLSDGTISKKELQALASWLKDDPHLTQGELVREFEKRFAAEIGRPYAVFVNSGSSANLLAVWTAIESGRVERGDVAAVPAVSWATSVMPCLQLGLDAHFVDAEPETLGLDLDKIPEKAELVVAVHVLGVPAKGIDKIPRKHFVIEDACGALGSALHCGPESRKCGTFGDISTFSFYYGHQMSTIEGGMLVMDDPELAEIARMCRAHGWAVDLEDDRRRIDLFKETEIPNFNERFTFYRAGFNVRANDLQAKIGLLQLETLRGVSAIRNRNYHRYARTLEERFIIPENQNADVTASIGFGVMARNASHRDYVASALERERIETRPIGGGNMARQPFVERWLPEQAARRFPNADAVHTLGFQLPNHANLSGADIDEIAGVVLGALES